MSNYSTLKGHIDNAIYQNDTQDISGTDMNSILKEIVDSFGAGYLYMGVATPSTDPSTPDQNVFYIAGTEGTYTNFGGITVANEVAVLKYNGAWSKQNTGIKFVSVSQNTSTGHTDITIGDTTTPVASVEDVSQLGQELQTPWIIPAGIFPTLPEPSLYNEGDYVLLSLSDAINRVYKKESGSWTNNIAATKITPNTLYCCNGIIYYKESVTDTGKFVPINDKTFNRLNIFDDFADLPTSNANFSKVGTTIGKGYANVVYKATVAAGVAGTIYKTGLSLDGCCVSFLYKTGNNSNTNLINVRFDEIILSTPSITRYGIGNGWYFYMARITGTVQTIQIIADLRSISVGDDWFISDLKICEGANSLIPSLIPKDVRFTTPDNVSEMISDALPASFDIKKAHDITNAFYPESFDTTLSILGKPETFKVTNSSTQNVDYAPGTIGNLGFVAGVPNRVRIFGYAQSQVTMEFSVYDFEAAGYIYQGTVVKKVGWGSVLFTFELTETQMTHTLRLRVNCNGTTIYKIITFSGVDNPSVFFPNTLNEIEDRISSIGSDWYNKRLATYGDSVTAICNGDYEKPFSLSDTKWANKAAQYFGMANQYGRGIGSQCFGWMNGGGSIAWCTADGNMVGRLDGTSYDDYLNPATQQSVLDAITALGYNPSVHTLIRGSLSSWLRITTQFPAPIKSNIDVVLVMAHNDAIQGTQQYRNADLSFVPNSVIDAEWAASSYYSTYGGDYNLDGSLKGAIASTIMKFQAWMPQAVIVLMTPISGLGVTGELNMPLTSPAMQSVAEGVRFVHNLMSIPLIDMYGFDGINGANRTSYITDEIHPYSVAGGNMLGRVVVGGLKTIMPMDLFD